MAAWYSDSKIYILRSPNTDDYFIGSTCSTLKTCLVGHSGSYKAGLNRPSLSVMSAGDVYISLLEDFPCSSKKELTIQENIVKANYKDAPYVPPEPIKRSIDDLPALDGDE